MIRILLAAIMINFGAGSALLPAVSAHDHNTNAGITIASGASDSKSTDISHSYMVAGNSHEDSHSNNHSENSHSPDCSKCTNHCHSSHCFQMLPLSVSELSTLSPGPDSYTEYEMIIPRGIISSLFRPPIV